MKCSDFENGLLHRIFRNLLEEEILKTTRWGKVNDCIAYLNAVWFYMLLFAQAAGYCNAYKNEFESLV